MRKFSLLVLLVMLCLIQLLHAQNDTLTERTLQEVVLSANKWEQKITEVPNKITKINRADIYRGNPQTAADMLTQTGTVFVQKSQLGGGSPMIRGFATNRVMLVVDGVRMNNAIYRSGNLQNIISIDPLALESAEVIFGPGSLIYGSDAIGGVMNFRTLAPRLSTTDKVVVKGSALARYSSANSEKTGHADLNIGGRKWSFLGSVTYSDFDDLKMGKNGGQDSYLRPEYVQRIDNVDKIIKNADPRVQRFSGYEQTNFLGKLRFKPNAYLDLSYSFNYAETGNAPRYDRLIQYRNGLLRFAEWEYGPMIWRTHNVQALLSKKSGIADKMQITAAYQNYDESRIDRARGNNNRTKQAEHVDAYNLNIDASKEIGKGSLFYGVEHVYNLVGSTGRQTNISTGNVVPFNSRYPDGSEWATTGVYASYKVNVHPKITLNTGLRYSYNMLNADFDTTFIKFPYKEARLREGGVTGNIGAVYRPAASWQLNANVSTGFRMPNVDDIGKLFESTPGNITVPNPDLKSEYAWNFEAGIVKQHINKLRLELTGFYTILQDAIVRRPSRFNGSDSINFGGTRSRVEALQNVAKATVWGAQASLRYYFTNHFFIQTNANWISGKETDDVKNEQVALRHAPPFYGSTHFRYQKNKWDLEAYALYSGETRFEDLAPSEAAKPDIYAKDAQGQPFSPRWHTFNFKGSYQILNNLYFTAGCENINNQRYRPYSSGIVASGANFIVALRASF